MKFCRALVLRSLLGGSFLLAASPWVAADEAEKAAANQAGASKPGFILAEPKLKVRGSLGTRYLSLGEGGLRYQLEVEGPEILLFPGNDEEKRAVKAAPDAAVTLESKVSWTGDRRDNLAKAGEEGRDRFQLGSVGVVRTTSKGAFGTGEGVVQRHVFKGSYVRERYPALRSRDDAARIEIFPTTVRDLPLGSKRRVTLDLSEAVAFDFGRVNLDGVGANAAFRTATDIGLRGKLKRANTELRGSVGYTYRHLLTMEDKNDPKASMHNVRGKAGLARINGSPVGVSYAYEFDRASAYRKTDEGLAPAGHRHQDAHFLTIDVDADLVSPAK